MELSRERSPPAAAQELPGGERYLERGFPLFVFFSFFLYLAGKVFPFHLLFFCMLPLFFCLLLLLWLLLFLLLLNLLSVCCVLGKNN